MYQNLVKNINIALNIIEMLGEVLISGVPIGKNELTDTVANGVLQLFPQIVDNYIALDEDVYREEIEYWARQLERVLDGIDRNDSFFLLDVLCYETKENLIILKKTEVCIE